MSKRKEPVHGSPYLPEPIAAVYELVVKRDDGTVGRYIGESRNVITRHCSLLNNLDAGSCHSSRLQADYDRYGFTRVYVRILDRSPEMADHAKRKDREHRLILKAISDGADLYNVNLDKDDGKYWRWTESPDDSTAS